MNPKNVQAEFARALKSRQAARLLHADRLYEDAVSRAYYAVMHAAKAALLVHDRIAESHAAVRRLFGLVLVRNAGIEKEWSAILARLQDRRAAADYNVALLLDAESCTQLVRDAERFVERTRKHIGEGGIALAEGQDTG